MATASFGVVDELVAHLAQSEQGFETTKVAKKLRTFFLKAAKGLKFNEKPFQELVHDYARAVFTSIFQGLSECSWLCKSISF